MSSSIDRLEAAFDTDVVELFAEGLILRQMDRFYRRFGRWPEAGEPSFFAADEPPVGDPVPLAQPELLALVTAEVMEQPGLGMSMVAEARCFAVAVLLRLGLPADDAEAALRGEGAFLLH